MRTAVCLSIAYSPLVPEQGCLSPGVCNELPVRAPFISGLGGRGLLELLHKTALSARAQRGGQGRACAAARQTELHGRRGTERTLGVFGLGRAAPGAQRGAVAWRPGGTGTDSPSRSQGEGEEAELVPTVSQGWREGLGTEEGVGTVLTEEEFWRAAGKEPRAPAGWPCFRAVLSRSGGMVDPPFLGPPEPWCHTW